MRLFTRPFGCSCLSRLLTRSPRRSNVPLSLLLVLVTLVCGAATVPLAVQAVFGGAGFALDAEALFSSLANSVLAPLATGVTLSLLPLVRTSASRRAKLVAPPPLSPG